MRGCEGGESRGDVLQGTGIEGESGNVGGEEGMGVGDAETPEGDEVGTLGSKNGGKVLVGCNTGQRGDLVQRLVNYNCVSHPSYMQ